MAGVEPVREPVHATISWDKDVCLLSRHEGR